MNEGVDTFEDVKRRFAESCDRLNNALRAQRAAAIEVEAARDEFIERHSEYKAAAKPEARVEA